MVSQTHFPLSQFATRGSLSKPNWCFINEELATMILPLHLELNNNIISTRRAADEFATLTESHLDHHGILKRKPFQKSQNSHREITIVHLSKHLTKIKNDIRYTLPFNPTRFLNAMRTHNKAKKAADHLHQRSSTKKQEKAFQKKTPGNFLNQFVRIIMCSRLQPFHRKHVIITLNCHTQTKNPHILNCQNGLANLRY